MADSTLEFKQHTQGVPRIQAVERTVKLLNLFSVQRAHLSLGDLAEGLGTTKGTAHRYAASLVDAGVLIYDSTTNTYSMSIKVLSFAAAAMVDLSVVKVAKERMTKLAHELDQTIVLAMWDETSGRPIITDFEYSTSLGVRVTIGHRLHKETAHWKLFNAFLQPECDANGTGAGLDPEAQEIRESGLAITNPEGYWVIAAPILDRGNILASLAIVGMGDHIPAGKRSLYCETMRTVTQELSKEITMMRRVSKAD